MRARILLATIALSALAAAPSCWAADSKARSLPDTVCGGAQGFSLSTYQGTPGSFLCNVKSYCQDQTALETPLGGGTKQDFRWDVSGNGQLLSFDNPQEYPQVKDLGQLTWLEPSGVLGNGLGTAVSDAMACTPQDTYRSLMNAAFNCALWGTKMAIHKQVAEVAGDDAFKAYLNKLDGKLSDKLKPAGEGSDSCDKAPSCVSGLKDTPAASLSLRLVNETSYRQCVYRFYLLYLDATVAQRGPGLLGDKFKSYSGSAAESVNTWIAGSGALSSEMVSGLTARLRAKIAAQDAGVTRSYLASISAFSEFARTYGPHIMLQLIERDYTRLRDALDALMTPVSQVLYKATNAMGSKGTK